ncbi:uncharacterized protein LOC126665006 [Mercurialis annua]|uniref:uncharacterized protein LOC126665006 n=1 Tax=Mercurialis annua TaxID=3986 RepID=UPI00215E97A8|nr:uncharacterized protein LOC126665006 [Mercurialis annua]
MMKKWIILGDFNSLISNLDKVGGNDVDMQASDEFKSWVSDANIAKLKKFGNCYTWTNNQHGGDNIWRKIDWCFVNSVWLAEWPESFYETKSPSISIIARFWIMGVHMFKVCQKLKLLRKELRVLNKEKFSEFKARVDKTREMVSKLQSDLHDDPFNKELQDEKRTVSSYLFRLLRWEESIARKKSRMLWIDLGDKNTKYFHRCIKQREAKNKIIILKVADGSIIEDRQQIKEDILRHYKSFLGTAEPNRINANFVVFDEGYVLMKMIG